MAKKHVVGTGTTEPTTKGKTVKVEATQVGYYDHVRRRLGDVFTCDEKDFTDVWMAKVGARTPEKITTSAEHLKKIHDDELAARSGAATAMSTGDDVI